MEKELSNIYHELQNITKELRRLNDNFKLVKPSETIDTNNLIGRLQESVLASLSQNSE